MRIISKFKDYYDTAMGMGIDPNLIYRREPRTIDFERWPFDKRIVEILRIAPTWKKFTPQLAVIGVCGRIHTTWIDGGFALTEEALSKNVTKSPVLTIDVVLREFLAVAEERHKPRSTRNIEFDREASEDLARDYARNSEGRISDDAFLKLSAPAFVVFAHPKWTWYSDETVRVITNPRLATLGFNHVLDSYTAFQEISMFLGSQLAPEDKAPRTSGDDKTIAAAKGFDEQSFRTQAPGHKKLNRKANKARKNSGQGETGS